MEGPTTEQPKPQATSVIDGRPAVGSPPRDAGEGEESAPDPILELEHALRRIRENAITYVMATWDVARIHVRNALFKTAMLLLAALLLLLAATVGIVLFLIGVSQAVASGLGGPAWSGYVAVGVVSILIPIIACGVFIAQRERRRFEAAKARYEARRAKHDN